jgi:hypothetical protein
MKILLLIFVLSLAALAPAYSQQPAGRADEMVPMRDGVKLATTIYLPDGEGPWPVVLVRTPYGKDLCTGQKMIFENA